MSITKMVNLGIERQKGTAVIKTFAASGTEEQGSFGKKLDSATEKVTAFIPAEAIGIYVAWWGIWAPSSVSGKWWIFGICLALVPILVTLGYLLKRKRLKERPDSWIAAWLCVFAMVAFVAWVCALPATPFLSVTPSATQIGAIAMLILAAVMYPLAELLDIVPKQ